ncbi:methylmalonyl Co-A mutase-associated GTPase MeaB [Thermodesulfobacteriota bacterium B35]
MQPDALVRGLHRGDARSVARAITLVEEGTDQGMAILEKLDRERIDRALVVGMTGPPGAGKSTLSAQLIAQLRDRDLRVGIVAVDPSSPISGGAILGDRIRMMRHALDPEVAVRSMATRGRLGGLCSAAGAAVRIMAASGCRVILLETVGIGQSEMDIVALADITVMVLAPGFGDDIQAMKAGILEVADLLVINKADQPGARRLHLDLAAACRDGDKGGQKILETVASEGQGVDELLDRIFLLEEELRQGPGMRARRARSFELETLDQALELLREPLRRRIRDMEGGNRDPRRLAREIVDRLVGRKPGSTAAGGKHGR